MALIASATPAAHERQIRLARLATSAVFFMYFFPVVLDHYW
jgi:hypothetical protein